ncbi:zinc transporter ZIP9-like [Diaphorina citri]|uniref:Zinc transporter ZIP9-like n=1 Tax=Diaphorina citri TaxID=121845 RepID=A0A3Q0JE92_DIACI|nr:zinc transporter ZIP9-like [Diaphorina citri]
MWDILSDIESGLGVSSAKITATLGLVVHSAVDGVALGAAATTTHTDVEMIVFIAIMLHKAPAAFGLVTFLLHEGVDRKRIRKHLLVFSLAAPTLALVTFFGIGKVSENFSTLDFCLGGVVVARRVIRRAWRGFNPSQEFGLVTSSYMNV